MRSLLVLLSLLVATSASAQTPHVNAVGLPEKGLITVDGVLDEAAWSRAEPITDFMGIEPTEGLPPEAPTTVRVLFDDKFIYFGFDCELADPEASVRGYVAAREDINRDDQVGIYLDPFGDARRAYIFYINAFGQPSGAGSFPLYLRNNPHFILSVQILYHRYRFGLKKETSFK